MHFYTRKVTITTDVVLANVMSYDLTDTPMGTVSDVTDTDRNIKP